MMKAGMRDFQWWDPALAGRDGARTAISQCQAALQHARAEVGRLQGQRTRDELLREVLTAAPYPTPEQRRVVKDLISLVLLGRGKRSYVPRRSGFPSLWASHHSASLSPARHPSRSLAAESVSQRATSAPPPLSSCRLACCRTNRMISDSLQVG
jgi:hypothetical protein